MAHRLGGMRDERGFTVIELTVVILIMSILVGIALASFAFSTAKAKSTACKANLRTMDGAYQTWLAQQTGTVTVPATFALEMAQLSPSYIKAIPTCPAGGVYTFTAPANTCNIAGHTYP